MHDGFDWSGGVDKTQLDSENEYVSVTQKLHYISCKGRKLMNEILEFRGEEKEGDGEKSNGNHHVEPDKQQQQKYDETKMNSVTETNGDDKRIPLVVNSIPSHIYNKWIILINEFYSVVRSKDKDFDKEFYSSNGNLSPHHMLLKRRIPLKDMSFQYRSEQGAEEVAEEAIGILTSIMDETRHLFRLGNGRMECDWSDEELLSNEMVR